MWQVKTKVVPIVLGASGTVPLRLKGNLKDIGVDTSITLIQKSALRDREGTCWTDIMIS